MKILQIIPQLESGGVERGTIDLARELIRRGHQAFVISAGGKLVRQLEEMGAVHYCLPVQKKSILSIIRLAREVAKILREENIDIVHARSRVPAWIAFLATRRLSTVFITTCHGYYSKQIFSRVMGWSRYVIVISEIIAQRMMRDFNVHREKIRLIYRGVDLNEFKPRLANSAGKKEKIITMVGRISPIKGHTSLIRAMPGIISDNADAKLWIVGSAPKHREKYLRELKNLVADLRLEARVEFLGARSDIPEILRQSDVLVMATTTQEAFGRVIIEAGAVGVPVVATSVGGVVEVLAHEKEGLLVEPGDPHALSLSILRMLKDREFAEKCTRALRRKVEEKFNLKTMVDKTIAVYEEAIKKKNILVLKFGALGDVILISASLRQLRKNFPDARIDVAVKKQFRDILQICPYIDNIFELKDGGIIGLLKNLFLFRKISYDISVDFQNNHLSHILAYAALIPRRFGFRNKKSGWLLNAGIMDKRDACDPVSHQFRVLESLGIKTQDKHLEMWLRETDRESIKEFLKKNWHDENRLLIGINPLSSARWITKNWFAENYAETADMLASQLNARVIFTGTIADKPAIDDIIRRTNCKPINAAGQTSIMELAALIEKCDAFITVDSAPMHMAAAVGTPFVALFGPTDHKRHLPSAEKSALISKHLECAPCYSPKCFRRNCMKEISTKEVVEATVLLIKKYKGEKHENPAYRDAS